jgi:hypothetical protein
VQSDKQPAVRIQHNKIEDQNNDREKVVTIVCVRDFLVGGRNERFLVDVRGKSSSVFHVTAEEENKSGR